MIRIIVEINRAPFYCILTDTTPDSSNKGQLSIVIRYVDNAGIIQERLLQIMEAVGKT